MLSLKKWRLRGDLMVLYKYLEGDCSQGGYMCGYVCLFSQTASNRIRGNGLKLYLGCLDWILQKISSQGIGTGYPGK